LRKDTRANMNGQYSSNKGIDAAFSVDVFRIVLPKTHLMMRHGKLSMLGPTSSQSPVGPRHTFPYIHDISAYHRHLTEDFALGFRKFAKVPLLGPTLDAPEHAQSYARSAATSRLRPIEDGVDLWIPASVPVAVPPLSPAKQLRGKWPGHIPPSVQPYASSTSTEAGKQWTFGAHVLGERRSSVD
jgi:hypothetical protein